MTNAQSIYATSDTPALSPSTGLSPALSTVLKSPALSVLDLQDTLPAGKAAWKGPDFWAHRGLANSTLPENTMESFREACRLGATGIETDIHMSTDNILVMFHDAEVSKKTDGVGKIHELPWKGYLENVRTKQAPHLPMPLFVEVLDFLLEPAHLGIKLNIDCKPESDPVRLFGMIKDCIEDYPDWAIRLAPRLILGLWHPKFVLPAVDVLPYLPRYAITMDLPQVKKHFYDNCHGFSVMYEALASSDGAKFRQKCREDGRWICVWTVNEKEEMKQCIRWGVGYVISDRPAQWRDIKQDIIADEKALQPTLYTKVFPFLAKRYYQFDYQREADEWTDIVEEHCGPFDAIAPIKVPLHIATPSNTL